MCTLEDIVFLVRYILPKCITLVSCKIADVNPIVCYVAS